MRSVKISNKHFIFIVSETEGLAGEKISAHTVLKHRLSYSIWGLNKHTKNKKAVERGANVIFYVAGTAEFSKCFVAKATVSGFYDFFTEADLPKYTKVDKWLYDIPLIKLALSDIQWFMNPVDIHSIMSRMDLFRNKKVNNWGFLFQGGTRAISETDYNLILSRSFQ